MPELDSHFHVAVRWFWNEARYPVLGKFPPLSMSTHYIQIQIVTLGFFLLYLSTTVQTGFPEGGEAGWATQKSCGETAGHDEAGDRSCGHVVWEWEVEGACCCGSQLPAKKRCACLVQCAPGLQVKEKKCVAAENWRWPKFTDHPNFCPRPQITCYATALAELPFGFASEQKLS